MTTEPNPIVDFRVLNEVLEAAALWAADHENDHQAELRATDRQLLRAVRVWQGKKP
jgi:hypothetical protein